MRLLTPQSPDAPFARWLTGQTHAARLTPAQVARKTGLNPGTLSRILSGATHPTRETVEKLGSLFHAREAALSVAGYSGSDPLANGRLASSFALDAVRDYLDWLIGLGVFGAPGTEESAGWRLVLLELAAQALDHQGQQESVVGLVSAALEPFPAAIAAADDALAERLIADAVDVAQRELGRATVRVSPDWPGDIVNALRGCHLLRGVGPDHYTLGAAPPLLPIAFLSLSDLLPWSSLKMQVPAEMPDESMIAIPEGAREALRSINARFNALSDEMQAAAWQYAKSLGRTLWKATGWALATIEDSTSYAMDARVFYVPPVSAVYTFLNYSFLVLPEDRYGSLLPQRLGLVEDDDSIVVELLSYWRSKSCFRLGYYDKGARAGCLAGTRLYHQINLPLLYAHLRRSRERLTDSKVWDAYMECCVEVLTSSLQIPNLEIRTADFEDRQTPMGNLRHWIGLANQDLTSLYKRDPATRRVQGLLLDRTLADQLLMSPDGKSDGNRFLPAISALYESGSILKAGDDVFGEREARKFARKFLAGAFAD
ncbi:MAG: helix-turn-helix domain-containing protein [Dehalococcoidia bacterium]|nr:helix-turn-helix domain-containing protein [Dehalococcoidia bacterium]